MTGGESKKQTNKQNTKKEKKLTKHTQKKNLERLMKQFAEIQRTRRQERRK